MRRAFFFIVAVCLATPSFASIPRASALDLSSPSFDALSETRIRVSEDLARFERPAPSLLSRALRQGYEQASTTNASGLAGFLSVDPARVSARLGEPQTWNRYSYATNNPLKYVDPDGRLRRTANGELIFRPTGSPIDVGHAGAPGTRFRVQPGSLLADDGTRIEAFKNLGRDPRFKCDCHGLSFADGKYWINNDQVAKILRGDSYQPAGSPRPGDIGVYRDSSGIVHSVTVYTVDESGRVTAVVGLGGLEMQSSVTRPGPGAGAGWHDPNAAIEYYRKPDGELTDEERRMILEDLTTYRKDQ